jgi:AcrR family transcriptional regulator
VPAASSKAVIWLRPEHAGAGRPAERSRAEITDTAVRLADTNGLDALSMRRVATELGTGVASLYRYVESRNDLLDLMSDSVAAEYRIDDTTGNWLGDLVGIGLQARDILRRHRWLIEIVATRPTIGPNGVRLIEHVLYILRDHPASGEAKLELFAMLNGTATLFVQNELAGEAASVQRQAEYLIHAAGTGRFPLLAEAFAAQPARSAPRPAEARFADLLERVLAGVAGAPASSPALGSDSQLPGRAGRAPS